MITEQELDRRLRSIATSVEWPAERDVTAGVAEAVASARGRRGTSRSWRPAIAAVAIVLLACTAVLVVSPSTRSAVARLLGFPGIAVEVQTDPLPELTGIDLGPPVALADAERRVGAPVRTLPLEPRRVHLEERTRAVHIVYRLRDGRIVLLTQIHRPDDVVLQKLTPDVRPAEVDGDFAMWATGPDHALMYVRGDEIQARLSENALLWQTDDVTYRLEMDGELPEAIRLAESLR